MKYYHGTTIESFYKMVRGYKKGYTIPTWNVSKDEKLYLYREDELDVIRNCLRQALCSGVNQKSAQLVVIEFDIPESDIMPDNHSNAAENAYCFIVNPKHLKKYITNVFISNSYSFKHFKKYLAILLWNTCYNKDIWSEECRNSVYDREYQLERQGRKLVEKVSYKKAPHLLNYVKKFKAQYSNILSVA